MLKNKFQNRLGNFYKSNIFFIFLSIFSCFFIFNSAYAASLHLSPDSGAYEQNKTFSILILVSSENQAINTAEVDLTFPTDKLEITSIDTNSSIFTLMVESPVFSNNNGTVHFSGIKIDPGFTGKNGQLAKITFKAKDLGQATISITGGQVLANDGLATDVLSLKKGATYTIIEKPIIIVPPIKELPIEKPLTDDVENQTTSSDFDVITPENSENIEKTTSTTSTLISSVATCSLDDFPYFFVKIGSSVFTGKILLLFLLILLIITLAFIYLNKIYKNNKKTLK